MYVIYKQTLKCQAKIIDRYSSSIIRRIFLSPNNIYVPCARRYNERHLHKDPSYYSHASSRKLTSSIRLIGRCRNQSVHSSPRIVRMLRIQASRCRMNAKRFAQHHLALAAYISWDMALLPIWITSGSCFALIHSGTNDVPPSPSRSCPSAIPSTISPRLAARVSIPGSFRLVFAQIREPMESFLISDESALPRPPVKVGAPFSSTDFISARFFFRVVRFLSLRKICDDTRSAVSDGNGVIGIGKQQSLGSTFENLFNRGGRTNTRRRSLLT